MPNMNGLQVIEALKEIETEGYLPVLVITANPGFKLSALEAGARDFVSTPLDLGEVLIRIHNMLEVHLLYLASKRLSALLAAEGDLQKERIRKGNEIEDVLNRAQARMSGQTVKLEELLAERTKALEATKKKLEDATDSSGKSNHRTLFL
jgi:DNA-binding response OmpR family regulator